MARTTVSRKNVEKPAPRWFRLTKKIVYLITASSLTTGTLSRLGVSSEDQLLIVGWLVMGCEILNIILANGEVYAPAQNQEPVK